jgi:N-glycosylase/DNA lyase
MSCNLDRVAHKGSVWQIAQRDYKFGKGKHKSLTKATYDAIGDHFRSLWGKEAGWAHSVLFTADLRTFSDKLIAEVEVKQEEKVVKNGESLEAGMAIKRKVKRKVEDDEVTVLEVEVRNGLKKRVRRSTRKKSD